MSNGRAKSGGEIGTNGEFYAGGTFLPSTELPKLTKKTRKPAAPRRQQVARYEWAETPNADARAIFSLIVGAQAQERNGVMSWFEPARATMAHEVHGHSVDSLIERWNNGERWV